MFPLSRPCSCSVAGLGFCSDADAPCKSAFSSLSSRPLAGLALRWACAGLVLGLRWAGLALGFLQCLLVDGGILLADNENRSLFPQVKYRDFRPFLRCMLGVRPPS